MVPVFLSIVSRYNRAKSRGTVHLALPALLFLVSMLYGGWELWHRAQLGGPRAETVVPGDTTVVFGPQRFDAPIAKRGDGAPIVSRFPTEITLNPALQHRYVVRVTNGQPDGSARVSHASIDGRKIDAQTGVLTFELTARAVTVLDIAIQAQPTPGHLTLEVLDVTGGTLLVFGMERFTRPAGRAVSFTRTFTVDGQAGAPFHLWVSNGNTDGTARLAEVAVSLNGTPVNTTLTATTGTVMTAVTPVVGPNELEIVLPAQGAGSVEIGISATDAMPPLLTITGPVPGLLTRDTLVTVTGTVTDRSAVAVSVNGTLATRSGNGFAATVALLEGENVLAIAAVDAAGARTDSARVVVRDRTAPTLIVTAPGEAFVTQAAITVAGSVTDAGTVTVTANSVPLPVDAAGAFTGSIPLAAGSSVVAVTATDAAGNGHTVVRMGAKQDDVVLLPFGGMQLTYSMVAQEAFTGTGALSGNWTAFDDAPERADGMMASSDEDDNLAFWDADAFSPDQYSQIVLGENAEEVGVAVRVSGTDMADATAYLLELHWEDPTELGLWKYVDATWSSLATYSGLSLEEGDTLRLEILGATLRFKINGVQIGADVTDTDLATGAAGFFAGAAASQQADNWEGGDISAQTGDGLAQEPFTGTGALSGNWTAFDTPALRDGDMLRGNSSGRHVAYWDAEEFHANQYSQLILGENPEEVGVAVRVSGTALSNVSAYWLEVFDADSLGLHKWVSGSGNHDLLAVRTGLEMEPGDVLRLEVNGARLRIKLNGQQLGTLVTDADLDAGAPGFVTGTSDADQGDFWEGGNLAHTGSALARDAFTGNGDLPSNWTPLSEPALREEDMLRGNSNDNDFAYWNAAWFSPDQYSQIVIGDNAEEVGVAVRLSGESPENVFVYWLEYQDSSQIGLHKFVGGTENYDQLAERTGLNIQEGDTMRLEIEGSTLRIKINGEQLGAPVTDTDIETGAAGFMTGQPALYQADDWEGGDLSQLPPDPVTVAPPINPVVPPTIGATTSFLYEGDNPIQTGVEPGTIHPVRAAVVRGQVFSTDGEPLPGVTVAITRHPEFGQTLSRADGWFDLAVNGGGQLTVEYTQTGYFPAQRTSDVPWQDYTIVDPVVLVAPDTAVTIIDFSDPIQVARGSIVTDVDSSRQATLLFSEGTVATMVLANDSTVALDSIHVRATEYSVGEYGISAMPAALPPTSAYTYAVEYSVDEAIAAGAKSVQFSEPVITYVENFIGFPVGMAVPAGYYDRVQSRWVPSDNGRVIKIISIVNDTARLDVIGNDSVSHADSLAALGITAAERVELANLYAAGQTLWRVPVSHFSPWDYNWPFTPGPNARPPLGRGPQQPSPQDKDRPNCRGGSIVECQSQVLREEIPLVGTPFSLTYKSSQMPGYGASRAFRIPLIGSEVPEGLKRIDFGVAVAGRRFRATFSATANQEIEFLWDGLDAYGRVVPGMVPATVALSYLYSAVYTAPASFSQAFAFPPDVSITAVGGTVFRDGGTGAVIGVDTTDRGIHLSRAFNISLGSWARGLQAGLGGWNLSVHHAYDPVERMVYYGDGSQQSAANLALVLQTFAGCGSCDPDEDVPATAAGLGSPFGVAAGPDGSLYISDRVLRKVFRVDTAGTMSTFAGTGSNGSSGDGGAATSAQFVQPSGIALGPDGSLYIADFAGQRVRRVDPQGDISTVAGTGSFGFSGDGGQATSAQLFNPNAVAVASDGSLYIADWGNHRIRRVSPSGVIQTVAGSGTQCFLGGLPQSAFAATCGDSVPATGAKLRFPTGVAIGPDGSLFIADGLNNRIRKVALDGLITTFAGDGSAGGTGDGGPALSAGLWLPNGIAVGPDGAVYVTAGTGNAADTSAQVRRIGVNDIITTVAGSGVEGFAGDGGPAPQGRLAQPQGVAVAPDGTLRIADLGNSRVRSIAPALPGLGTGSVLLASPSGTELFTFEADGRHTSTLHSLTGAPLLTFEYDTVGRLELVIDENGDTTAVERDEDGAPTAIVGVFGQETALSVSEDGFLDSIANPAGEFVAATYLEGGLLETFSDPKGSASTFAYDSIGRLVSDSSANGGELELARLAVADTTEVEVTTAEGRSTTYRTEVRADGDRREISDPAGIKSTQAGYGSDSLQFVDGDSTRIAVHVGPDPRFGMQSPALRSLSIELPSSLTLSMTAVQRDSVDDPGDPTSLVSMLDSVSLNGRTTVSVYTASTRRRVTTTSESRTFTTQLDSVGRVTMARAANLDSVMFSYDSLGRLEEQRQGGRIVTYAYDPGRGRLENVTDPLGLATQFEYDTAGRVTTQTRPDGSEILFAYDSAGNLTSLTPPGRPAHGFRYNAVGLVTQYDPPTIAAGAKPTKYFYNLDRQLDSIVRPDSITVAVGYDAAGRPNAVVFDRGTMTLGYSSTTGNLNRIRAPEGDSLLFTYDGSLQTQVRWSGTVDGSVGVIYDNDFRVAVQTVNNADTVFFSYDADGLLTNAGGLILGRNTTNGLLSVDTLGLVRSSYQYNTRGELSGYRVKHDTTTLFATGYVRDSLGRIRQLFDTTQGTAKRWSFVYDSLGRLVKDSVNGAVFHVFTYDSNGNRLSFTSGAGTVNYSYDNQDRVLWARAGTDTTHYRYGSNGELKLKIEPGADTTTYTYDALGNILAIVLPDDTEIEYVIDGQNRRVGRKVDGDLVQGWLYQDQLSPVAELDSAGNVVSRFVYGTRANVPDYMLRGDSVFRLVTDQLGSVRLLVDTASGIVAQRLDYDEWGNVTSNTNPQFQPFGFAGGMLDELSELTRFGARDYDSRGGRWTTKDPVGFVSGDPNLYAYVANDPIGWIDPLGRDAIFVRFSWYPVTIPGTKIKVAGGHGAVIAIDPRNGNTRYYEYGRYAAEAGKTGPPDAGGGRVRSQDVPNVKIGSDGRPTPESLRVLYDFISKEYGKDYEVWDRYFPDADFNKVIKYAEKAKWDRNRLGYSWRNNSCYTFATNAINAGRQ